MQTFSNMQLDQGASGRVRAFRTNYVDEHQIMMRLVPHLLRRN